MTVPQVVVATTMAAYKAAADRPREESEAWLTHAERWAAGGIPVRFFAALQVGQGHDEAFTPLQRRLEDLDGDWWSYSFDDGSDSITTSGRLHAICMGRNMAHEYVNRNQRFTHLLLLDSDVESAPDALERLLEVRWPVVAGHIPTYCLDGPRLTYEAIDGGPFHKLLGSAELGPWNTPTKIKRFPDDADVREHWSSAGCWMLTREAVNAIRWGWSLDLGATDDPWTAALAAKVGLGPMWTRHDVVCIHHPQTIAPVEMRGHDLSVVR